ncbi:hypothetical protein ABZ461_20495 [Actinacidiphila glaucinigra]|uniref:hypothetical protein n=1 Tax=Actinacidiphila glaucinigra TaxID=235986 RepID=UPI0033DF2BDF
MFVGTVFLRFPTKEAPPLKAALTARPDRLAEEAEALVRAPGTGRAMERRPNRAGSLGGAPRHRGAEVMALLVGFSASAGRSWRRAPS